MLDILIIAFGFLLRIYAGGQISNVPISNWLVLIVFLLALFIAFAKRRDDYLIYQREGTMLRKSITGYNLRFIDASAVILLTLTIVCYIMYSLSPEVATRLGSNYVFVTSFPVIIGLLRYLQITYVLEISGSPIEIIYKDHFLQTTILIWLAIFTFFLYF